MLYISNLFTKFLAVLVLICLFISIFFIPIIQSNEIVFFKEKKEFISLNPNGFLWPLPGYTSISSPFGKRFSPVGSGTSFHHGIDIPAPEGTKFVAVADGVITFCSFLGAGGYTITLSFDNYKVTYCHASPNYIVTVGEKVKQGQVIRVCGT